jgi:adenosylhomocysteine nucleosidase
MPEEIDLICSAMTDVRKEFSGKREFHIGNLNDVACVVALSRIGKVASSVTAAVMIEKYHITHLIVTGVAGAISPKLRIGDLVVANDCVQHDLDARPLFPQFEAPLLNKAFFECDAVLVQKATNACKSLLTENLNYYIKPEDIETFRLDEAKVHIGQLCCGDQFIGTEQQLTKIRTELPEALCVEMEGGAVGQVCYEYQIPYVVIRSISDGANDEAHVDFNTYINSVSRNYCLAIVMNLIGNV